jgi:DNA-directed RNA polymerase subunit RPC12/RpoP
MPNIQRNLFKRAKINRIKLDGCTLHRYDPEAFAIMFGAKAVCMNCGGEMGVLEIAQYIRGYIAAGGNPNLVLPGYFGEGGTHSGYVHCPSCNGRCVLDGKPCDLCGGTGEVPTATAIRYVEAL